MIELLVVIIIGVLSAIALPLPQPTSKARAAEVVMLAQ